ncbi:anthranilate synthase component I [Kingella negevensis]|uniref:Anthranilate synthase component 1 n=1 Tax=Kingella negevensis TaxID=1522312 RepID=A0A238T9J4_9NEIS|nr:anthranilate synthase component I [Kingella negevensis]MDK4684676.1 anthranilate synthase component I [Kingella negevensis]MDK4696582.1 anthranilate synthase component I [Kingella negevensis]MDK4707393.1 anthranilate synthase component I [Kingella negevensis]MDK4710130.1 anthranilate synthase component I [Kingella negevensis]SNB54610.1 Anthranilate synthase component 1 [Kingella negevensis]
MQAILNADILTPMVAYMRVAGAHKIILESIPREKENARFSIIAYNPVYEVKFANGQLTVNGDPVEADPLDYLNQLTVKNCPTDLPFSGGAIGFVGYDMIGLYEDIGTIPADTIGTPDMHFFVYESYLIFDHKKEKVFVVEDNLYSQRSEADMQTALDTTLRSLKTQAENEFKPQELHALNFKSHVEQSHFEDMVAQAQKLIREGDMFQCVLSQRFSSEFVGEPLDYYRNLRVTNPSNYLYFYDFGDYQIIGASPESLVSLKDGIVTTNPIAGTRPRGKDETEDKHNATELANNIKETAEHRMLVDLGRNDIGKIAEIGSVRVSKYMEVEYFRYVMHLTSVVKGKLLPQLTGMNALKSTLPAGTVSGAPKIRAMKRIYELEQEKRGIYSGAIGYLSASGDMDFAITIRTMVLKNGRAYVQAGAGIVYDSVPASEYQETVNKAKAMTKIGEAL